MDFECNFNDLNFCQYSNFGWGFHKSFKSQNNIKPISNIGNEGNFYPCSVSNSVQDGSKLEKKILLNISQSLCLHFAYLLEDKGYLSVTNGKNKWMKNSTDIYPRWSFIRFPLNINKAEQFQETGSESSILRITGESVCVDNFTVSPQSCPLATSTLNDNFSFNTTFWLTQPFSLLVAIISLTFLFIFIGLMSSIMFARKTQRTLSTSKHLSQKLKLQRPVRFSFQNSIENYATFNSSCEIGTIESNPFYTHNNRFLPTVVHVRSNPQSIRYSTQSFMASPGVDSTVLTPHYRFSLALTEDAQVQLLKNNNFKSNNDTNNTNTTSSSHFFLRNMPIALQQSITTTFSHESSPSPNEASGSNDLSNSMILTPSFCVPIIDQSESDASVESLNVIQNVSNCDRSRPIVESTNTGYVSDTSICDLPQYDTAVQLLAECKIKLVEAPDLTYNCDTNET